jgi:hypothetical protein
MRESSFSEIQALAVDLELELAQMQRLEQDILVVQQEIQRDPERAHLFYEVQALKLHNFYTGCERIFSLIVSEFNGGKPSGFDWHQRLLQRMAVALQDRPQVISPETAQRLKEYLGFRHVVRNVYGFDLDIERVARLIQTYPDTWHQFDREIKIFVAWLQELVSNLQNE